jgi:hypothetical protein
VRGRETDTARAAGDDCDLPIECRHDAPGFESLRN